MQMKKNPMATVAPILLARMKALRYTQFELAIGVGMNPVLFCRYLHGQRCRFLHPGIVQIGKVLGLDAADCFVTPPQMSASPALPSGASDHGAAETEATRGLDQV